jgi:hypothetical protein
VNKYDELMTRWDKLEAAQAVARAWQDPGPRHGSWHKRAREELAYSMPLLARHLDRLLVELELPPVVEWELWES